MKVLVMGRDPGLFKENSEVFRRALEYSRLFEEYHVVSMSGSGFEEKSYGPLKIYPTNSRLIFLRLLDSLRLGIKIIKDRHIDMLDAQDPGESGITAFLLSKIAGVPFRLQIHTDIFSPYYRSASWKELLRYQLAKFLIPRADCLRVVSQRIKESIESRIKNQEARISVLPIFTEVTKFIEAKPDQKTQTPFLNYYF